MFAVLEWFLPDSAEGVVPRSAQTHVVPDVVPNAAKWCHIQTDRALPCTM